MDKDIDPKHKIPIERTGEEEHKKLYNGPKYLEPVPKWFQDKYINGKEVDNGKSSL